MLLGNSKASFNCKNNSDMNGSLPLLLYCRRICKPPLHNYPDLVWGLYMPTNPSLPASAHTHTSGKCFLPPAQQPLPGAWSSCDGNEMAAFIYLRETAESSWAWKSTAKDAAASQDTDFIISGSIAELPIKCSQSKQASSWKHHTDTGTDVTVLLRLFSSCISCKVAACYIWPASDILVTQLLVVVNKNLNWWLFLMCHRYFLTTDDQLHSPSFQKICIVHYVSS